MKRYIIMIKIFQLRIKLQYLEKLSELSDRIKIIKK